MRGIGEDSLHVSGERHVDVCRVVLPFYIIVVSLNICTHVRDVALTLWLCRILYSETESPCNALNAVRFAVQRLSGRPQGRRKERTHKSGGARLLFFNNAVYKTNLSAPTPTHDVCFGFQSVPSLQCRSLKNQSTGLRRCRSTAARSRSCHRERRSWRPPLSPW